MFSFSLCGTRPRIAWAADEAEYGFGSTFVWQNVVNCDMLWIQTNCTYQNTMWYGIPYYGMERNTILHVIWYTTFHVIYHIYHKDMIYGMSYNIVYIYHVDICTPWYVDAKQPTGVLCHHHLCKLSSAIFVFHVCIFTHRFLCVYEHTNMYIYSYNMHNLICKPTVCVGFCCTTKLDCSLP